MLLRLDVVEEIGRFAKLQHKAEQFSRLSLVYARNGYGKSTVCAILRSASENQPNYITSRRRLDAKNGSRIQSSWANGSTVAFGNGKWNACPGKIYVFDQEFVHKNLHLGESVTRDNKRSLLPVILGSQGVDLSQKIIDLDHEQRELSSTMAKLAAAIQAKCPIVDSPNLYSYCTREIPDELEKRISKAEQSVELAAQAALVQGTGNFVDISLPNLDSFVEIASRTLDSISGDIQQQVRNHIEVRQLGHHGDRWLKYGTEHSRDDICPFCDQDTSTSTIVAAYKAYFSTAFGQLITDRDTAIDKLDAAINGGLLELFQTNDLHSSFWSKFCELPGLPNHNSDIFKSIEIGVKALRLAMTYKVTDPLHIVEFLGDTATIETAFGLLQEYSRLIRLCQAAVEVAKNEATASNLPNAQHVLLQWRALEARRTDPIRTAASEYAKAETRRQSIEQEKKSAQTALTSYAKNVMEARQTEINNLLSAFGASFKICDAKANFRGREPNTDYAIAIGDRTLLVGEKSDTAPSFKTVLSAGDKTTLALAFFISQVRADSDLSKAVVVFDDPFNSQDANRQFETTSQLRAIARNSCQTFVFSHDARFLNMIERDADHSMVRTFQLLCTDKGQGTISPWSSEAELKTLYVRQSEMIREYANQGTLLKDTTEAAVLQAFRPFLEDYIKARFPGRFASHELIVPMVQAISDAGPSDPLFESVEDFRALNEYSRVNMHGGGNTPDPTALRAQARKIVALVGQY